MKVALVSPLIYPSPPPFSGGTERIVHDLGEALLELGCDVTVFAAEGSRSSGELVTCGPAVSTVEGAPPGYPAAREAALLEAVRRRRDEFDIIHCHTEFMHAPVLADARDRTVTTVHWRVDEADRQFFFEAFPDLPVVAISQAQAGALPASARRIATVPHGLPEAKYRPGDGRGGYVAFLGRMTDQKGPDRAIRAAREAGLTIRLAGDIDVGNPGYFDERVRPLLSGDAEYIGPIGDAQKQEFLGNAVVFAMPIDWPEPFGLVMIEAMACGTPVVATPFGAAAEVLSGGGGLVAASGDFPAALRQASGMDRRGVRRAFAQRFTARRMAEGYLDAYDALLSGAAGRA